LNVGQRVIDPVEDRSEDMCDRRPIVRHLVNDVLSSRDSRLFCFVIHFSLDCALATLRDVAHRLAGP
jgi:hypothetical protein